MLPWQPESPSPQLSPFPRLRAAWDEEAKKQQGGAQSEGMAIPRLLCEGRFPVLPLSHTSPDPLRAGSESWGAPNPGKRVRLQEMGTVCSL